ncbi:GDSL-type esterase/lipase family protein [Daejeonella oryzae]|uniref:GDSL-type esterase/lipase family protein n=1 Tax=Daejeonella oryzae TaxID=1122943 RepID=UPI00047BD971|nr:GDSL-type esterase/lipase family protein [Daejeonella oryzae]
MNYLKFVLVITCIFMAVPGFSQTAKWDSTFRPSNFQNKVNEFKSYPNSRKDIIFLGNSITAGTEWSELLNRKNIKNRGISGDITFGVLERLDEVIEGKPSKVFILIGVNDISRNIPDEVILENYRKIVSRIKSGSPRTKIYFHTMLPTNNTYDKFKNHYNKEEHILWLNKALKELVAIEKITLIDLYPAFLDAEKRMDKKYTVDGLHLSLLGYARWKELLESGKYLK